MHAFADCLDLLFRAYTSPTQPLSYNVYSCCSVCMGLFDTLFGIFKKIWALGQQDSGLTRSFSVVGNRKIDYGIG